MRYIPVVHSVGIEVECHDISRDVVKRYIRNQPCKVINDGSIRTYPATTFGLPFIKVSDKSLKDTLYRLGKYIPEEEMGCEVISQIIDTSQPEWDYYVMKVMEELYQLGEGLNPSTSIHVHVNVTGLPLDVIRNVVNIWKSIESGMYKISSGEMGVYRGEKHRDSHFCRPWIRQGPHVQQNPDGKYRPCFDVNVLDRCSSFDELEKALNRLDKYTRHYHISRYMGLGIHPLFRQGSVEFRTFNFTFVPANIIAYVEVSKAIVRNAMDKYIEDHPKNPYGTANMTLDELINWLRITDLGTIYTLENLWSLGKFPAPLRGWRKTHVTDQTHFDWSGTPKKLVPEPVPDGEKIWDEDSLKAEDNITTHGHIRAHKLLEIIQSGGPEYV